MYAPLFIVKGTYEKNCPKAKYVEYKLKKKQRLEKNEKYIFIYETI